MPTGRLYGSAPPVPTRWKCHCNVMTLCPLGADVHSRQRRPGTGVPRRFRASGGGSSPLGAPPHLGPVRQGRSRPGRPGCTGRLTWGGERAAQPARADSPRPHGSRPPVGSLVRVVAEPTGRVKTDGCGVPGHPRAAAGGSRRPRAEWPAAAVVERGRPGIVCRCGSLGWGVRGRPGGSQGGPLRGWLDLVDQDLGDDRTPYGRRALSRAAPPRRHSACTISRSWLYV